MSKFTVGLLAVGVVLLFLIGCSGDPGPDPASTSTPTPTPTAAALSFDEYLAECSVFTDQAGLDDDATYGDFSAAIGDVVETMSSLAPPAEVADWHNKVLEFLRSLKGLIDSQPEDKVVGIEFLAFASEVEDLEEAATEAENALAGETRRRMVEAGCIEDSGTSPESAENDHGDDLENAFAIAAGEAVQGTLDGGDDKDVFVFHAEAGRSYAVELSDYAFASFSLGSKPEPEPLISVYDSAGVELARIEDGSARKHLAWQAAATGNHYVVLGDGKSQGDYTLTVSLQARPTATPAPEVVLTATPAAVATATPAPAVIATATPRPATPASDISPDRAVLEALYNAMDGPNWIFNQNWLSDRPIGEWFGVEADGEDRVIGLYLSGNQLRGEIPPELGNLANLEVLALEGNRLTGEIPPELGNLTNLVVLALDENLLSGEIPPELGNLTDLEVLGLTRNRLSGEIPPELGSLANLMELYLRGNQLSGCVPQELRNLWSSDLDLPFCGDHGDDIGSASTIAVGEVVESALEYDGDVDYFAFRADEGEVYRIDVGLLTLGDSELTLYNADGRELAYNDDYGNTLASRIIWEAPGSGEYYIAVSGWGAAGSYTLTIGLSDSQAGSGGQASTQGLTRLTDNSDLDGLPAWSPDGSRIAFTSDRDGNAEIYAMNADGSGIIRLTDDPGDDFSPSWSPDGSRILFTSDRDGDYELYVINADASGVIRLTDNSDLDWFSAWSPDGRRIAFSSDRDGNEELYVMNADGAGVTRLTDNSDDDWSPSWSPDGSRIAFASDRDGDYEIYVMNADGSGVTRLTDNSDVDFYSAWSPDGSRIAFVSDRDGNFELYVMNADGSGVIRLTDNFDDDWSPAWSPDGSRIAFTSDRDGVDELYVLNFDG